MASSSVRRAALAVAALLAGAIAVPGASAAPDSRLTLVGNRDAAAAIALTRTSTITMDDLRVDTKGTYAGLAVEDARGQIVAFTFNVRRWVESRPAAAKRPIHNRSLTAEGISARFTLSPGRYRLRLITDGPSKVSVPATADLARLVEPTTPAATDVRIEDVTAAPVLSAGIGSARVDLRRAKAWVIGVHTETTAHQASGASVCLAPVGATVCRPGSDLGGTGVALTAGALPSDGFVRSSYYISEGAPDDAGVYDALFRDVSVDLPARRDSIVLIF